MVSMYVKTNRNKLISHCDYSRNMLNNIQIIIMHNLYRYPIDHDILYFKNLYEYQYFYVYSRHIIKTKH